MNYETERKAVLDAGHQLVEKGLIARTWGNISCLTQDDVFVVTPSGRTYDTLQLEDMVPVHAQDLSYLGKTKPSSEIGIHRAAYQMRKDARFVIHTHQLFASTVSSACVDIPVLEAEDQELLGEFIPMAAYGLPGTEKLWRGVSDAMERSHSNAVIMAYHGALCVGKDSEHAFAVAMALERACARYLASECLKRSTANGEATDDLSQFFLQENRKVRIKACQEAPTGVVEAVKANRPELPFVMFTDDAVIQAYSTAAKTLKPYLDDLAQIAGTTVKCVTSEKNRICRAAAAGLLTERNTFDIRRIFACLRGRNAVLLEGCGAICCGETQADAEAVAFVLRKGCQAAMAATLFEGAKPIHSTEARLMRHIYLTDYSKQTVQNSLLATD